MITTQNNFTSGINLASPKGSLAPGEMRRNKGINPLSNMSMRSRNGAVQLSTHDAHTIFYFNDSWYYGVSTSFYAASDLLKSALSGDRLSCIAMPPTAAVEDYLFCCGGGAVFKVDSDGNVTDWGISPPSAAPSATAAAFTFSWTSIRDATYKWTASSEGTGEYYCDLAAGGDPSISSPTAVEINSSNAENGTLGSLTANQWAYGNNDGLGFSTVYVRLADDGDPDGEAADYIRYSTTAGSLTGTYQYNVTFYNSSTGVRSDAPSSSVSVAPSYQQVELTSIPTSTDGQVDRAEIWRTGADGTLFFYLTYVANGTTTYTDTNQDSALSSVELPTDNLVPYSWFSQAIYHNAACFWIARSQSGSKGLIYYSPIGRCESVKGYISVTNDDDPLQSLFRWNSVLGVISESGVFVIQGTDPYVARRVDGCPGTTAPETVRVTPMGVFYEASDGIRVFDGSQSILVNPSALSRVFQGESVEDITAFTGVISGCDDYEYFISDLSQTLAVRLSDYRVRNVSAALTAMYYSREAGIFAATLSSAVVDFEKEGYTDDNSTDITIDWKPDEIRFSEQAESVVNLILIEADTSDEALTVAAVLDGTEHVAGKLKTPSRSVAEFEIDLPGRLVGVRIYGDVSDAIEIFSIDYDVYTPKGE